MRTIKLLLADDQRVIRESLKAVLDGSKGIRVVAEAATCEEAKRLTHKRHPDVILMDVHMPDKHGQECLRRMLARAPALGVVVLCTSSDETIVQGMISAGARAFVLKDAGAAELVQAVKAASRGDWFFCKCMNPGVVKKVLSCASTDMRPDDFGRLSRRERQILQSFGEGQTAKETAGRLALSVRTVEKHRERIRRKTGCRCVADLARCALREGFI